MSGADGAGAGSPGSPVARFGPLLGLRHHDPGEPGPVLTLRVSEDHLNGAGIAHGGVLFSALDEAVAIVANAAQAGSVLASATVHCLRPARPGDVLTARVEPVKAGRRLSVYEARLERSGELVAHMVAQTAVVSAGPA